MKSCNSIIQVNRSWTVAIFLVIWINQLSAQNSNYWGHSINGGLFDSGFLFKTNNDGTGMNIVHHFRGGEEGLQPRRNLTLGPSGKLYGIASGGVNDSGVIFSFDPSEETYVVEHHFDGEGPSGSLMLAANGNFYGYESTGSGYIFEFNPTSRTFSLIHAFNRTEGRVVTGNNLLIEIEQNRLLGVTKRGGLGDNGIIFSYDLQSSVYEVLFEFEGSGIGFRPEMIKTLSDGKLYGLTTGRFGTLFEFDYSSKEAKLIYEFSSDVRGLIPEVLLARDGNFYGVTGTSGVENSGSVFRYNPSDEEFSTLHEFRTSSGPHIPGAPLMEGQNGHIYGSTIYTTNITTGINIFQIETESATVEFKTIATGGTTMYKLIEVSNGEEEVILTLSKDQIVQVYPNPSASEAVVLALNKVQDVKVMVTRLGGEIIHHQTYHQIREIEIDIDVPGHYVMNIISLSDKQRYTHKIVKY